MIDQQEIDRARELASQGDTQSAIAALSQIIQRDSKNVDAWLALGKVVDEPERVEYCLNKVLALDPGNREALELLQRGEAAGSPESPEVQAEPIDLTARLESHAPAPEQGQASRRLEDGSHPEPDLRGGPEPPPDAEPAAESDLPSDSPAESESLPRQPELQASSERVDQGSGSIPRLDPISQELPQPPSASEAVTAPLPRPGEEKAGRFNRTDIILVGLTVVAGLVLCGLIGAAVVRNSLGPTETPEEVVQVVYENIGAANREDVAGYMATIHPDSPDYNSTNALIQDAFATYDLSYQIFIPEMLEQGRNRSVISFVLTTRKVRGPAFRDNQVSGRMTLRKHDGEWKIYDQTVEDVQYLN